MFLAAAGTAASAQTPVKKSEVPPPVIKAYLSQNSQGSNDTIWEKEVISIYKVKFVDAGKTYISEFYSDGSWIKTYTVISADELPMLAMNHIKAEYPAYAIQRCLIELNNNGKLYVVEMSQGKGTIREQFYMSGKLFR